MPIFSAWSPWVAALIKTVVTVASAYLAGHVFNAIVIRRLARVAAAKTRKEWDDIVVAELKRRIPFWSLLIGGQCGAHTFPYIESLQPSAVVEHEASTSRINEDQLFYLQSRGIDAEQAVAMIVNGFCKEVFDQLPMEFAVEAQKLLELSLEGSVG